MYIHFEELIPRQQDACTNVKYARKAASTTFYDVVALRAYKAWHHEANVYFDRKFLRVGLQIPFADQRDGLALIFRLLNGQNERVSRITPPPPAHVSPRPCIVR